MTENSRLTTVPLYKRAEDAMVARIVERVWTPGMRLPNEFKLASEFGVSQGTIRKALVALEERGLLARSPGFGTVVLRTTDEEALYAFFRMRDERGGLIVPEPLSEGVTRRPASTAEATAFQAPGSEVWAIERVRQFRGTPFTLECICLPTALCEGLGADLPLPNSLYPYLQDRFGLSIMTAQEALVATVADDDQARILRIAPGTPLLRVERQARDLANRVVELRTSFYLTSFASYRVELTRSKPIPGQADRS